MNDVVPRQANWPDLYAPTTIKEAELSGLRPEDVEQLLAIAESGNFPHINLYGAPGTGKSLFARLLVKARGFSVSDLNGASLQGITDWNQLACGVPLPWTDGKAVLIDEADEIPKKLQTKLKTVIDAAVNPFIFTCNDRSKLNEALQSRFMPFRFGYVPLDRRDEHHQALVRRCQFILESEGLNDVRDGELMEIVVNWYPNIRQTIIELQRKYQPRVWALRKRTCAVHFN